MSLSSIFESFASKLKTPLLRCEEGLDPADTVVSYISRTPRADKAIGLLPPDALCLNLIGGSSPVYECFSTKNNLNWRDTGSKKVYCGEDATNRRNYLFRNHPAEAKELFPPGMGYQPPKLGPLYRR